MNRLSRRLALLSLAALTSVAAWAGATKNEATAQVAALISHAKKVGVEQAIKDVNSAPEWKAGGMNVIINGMNGQVHASSLNEKLVGKNTLEAKDPTGKEYVKEFNAAAAKGEGWVDYQFINPTSKKLEERSMFVRKLPGFEGWVGVAISKN